MSFSGTVRLPIPYLYQKQAVVFNTFAQTLRDNLTRSFNGDEEQNRKDLHEVYSVFTYRATCVALLGASLECALNYRLSTDDVWDSKFERQSNRAKLEYLLANYTPLPIKPEVVREHFFTIMDARHEIMHPKSKVLEFSATSSQLTALSVLTEKFHLFFDWVDQWDYQLLDDLATKAKGLLPTLSGITPSTAFYYRFDPYWPGSE